MHDRRYIALLSIVVLCAVISLGSATVTSGPQALSAAAEGFAVGGSNCSDLMDGFAVGMGIAAIFGCVWCAAGAIGAKAIALFC
jgi:hypothetical protein